MLCELELLLDPPGVGKTHLVIGLGRAAVTAGYSVLFCQATTLVAGLAKAHGEGRLDDKLGQLAKPKLLIIVELSYLPFEPHPCRPSVLPTGVAALRARQHGDHVEPRRRRIGHGVR